MKQLEVHQRVSIQCRVYLATLAICDEYGDKGYFSDEESSLIAYEAKRGAKRVLMAIKQQRAEAAGELVNTVR